jgi:hypothetical protein
MVAAVEAYGGYVDKFIEDAVMRVWHAPVANPTTPAPPRPPLRRRSANWSGRRPRPLHRPDKPTVHHLYRAPDRHAEAEQLLVAQA